MISSSSMVHCRIIYVVLLVSSVLGPANGSRSFPRTAMESNGDLQYYSKAPEYTNGNQCGISVPNASLGVCDPSLVHVAMTLDSEYLRGSVAAVHSILEHTSCPQNVYFHFVASASGSPAPEDFSEMLRAIFPSLAFKVHPFAEERVKNLISSSIRQALDNPLNYARIYLADTVEPCVERVIYLDSDTIVVDDIQKLWSIHLSGSRVIGAPEYCHADFIKYFTGEFWFDPDLPKIFEGKQPCYFNTGVMVMELGRWRRGDFTKKIEEWMEIQRERRIYELGSLPPFMLVFGGDVQAIDHRWNQHGLGGDNLANSCRSLHPGSVSLMHWSGKGKPWVRLDQGLACPVDHLWAPYDLYRTDGHSEHRARW